MPHHLSSSHTTRNPVPSLPAHNLAEVIAVNSKEQQYDGSLKIDQHYSPPLNQRSKYNRKSTEMKGVFKRIESLETCQSQSLDMTKL